MGLPGTTSGPLLAPMSISARVSIERPPCTAPALREWQGRHSLVRIGRIFVSKNAVSEPGETLPVAFGGVCMASPAHAISVHPAINVVNRVFIIRCELPLVLLSFRPLRHSKRFNVPVVGLSTMRLLVADCADYMEQHLTLPSASTEVTHWYGTCTTTSHYRNKGGEQMSHHTSMTSKSTQSTIWQPISAIGGAVVLGIVLPMIKGCQEKSLVSQQPQAAPTIPTGDNAPEVASTKR